MLATSSACPDSIAESLKEEIFGGDSVVNTEFKPIKSQDKLNELSMLLTDYRFDDEDQDTDIQAFTGNGINVAWNMANMDNMVIELPDMFLVREETGWTVH